MPSLDDCAKLLNIAMNISISIPDEVVTTLERRAADRGQSVQAYAANVVADNLAKPTLDEILAPVREDFANSGMTEQELLDIGRTALRDVRLEQKVKSA